MVLKKGKKRRREAEEEDEEEDAQQILQPIEECCSDFFTQEILPRLPPNQLQKLKTVCRNWSSTISSPVFVRLHLKIYNESRIQVVVMDYCRAVEYKLNINSEETKQLPCPPANPGSYSLLGSCDGLLCLHYQCSPCAIEVYNPSTGMYFRPEPSLEDTTNYHVSCSWFGRHPCSGEYVLVLGNFGGEVIGVYKFNRRSNLTKIHSTTCSIKPQVYFTFHEIIGTLLHGVLHWPASRRGAFLRPRPQLIYSYHIQDNKYLEISPPVQDRCFKLGVVDGCLFAILKPTTNAVFEMWIMKEYGVQQSWIKYANIQGLSSFGDCNLVHLNDAIPLRFFPNGDLILDVRSKLIKYSFNNNKAELLTRLEYDGKAIMCPDSLVSPKIVGT